jgi:hypothetical protein
MKSKLKWKRICFNQIGAKSGDITYSILACISDYKSNHVGYYDLRIYHENDEVHITSYKTVPQAKYAAQQHFEENYNGNGM